MLLQVFYLSVVHFPVGVFNLALSNDVVVLPLSCNNFPWRIKERSFSIEFISKAIANVLVTLQELKVAFDFDTVLIGASNYRYQYLNTIPLA